MADRWALINSGVVVNEIIADQGFIDTIIENYDYCIDIQNLSPMPGVGWLYDGVNFSEPPIDYVQILHDDLSMIASLISTLMSDREGAISQDISDAISSINGEIRSGMSANKQDAWDAITTYLTNGD